MRGQDDVKVDWFVCGGGRERVTGDSVRGAGCVEEGVRDRIV